MIGRRWNIPGLWRRQNGNQSNSVYISHKDLTMRNQTIHFNIGNVGTPTLADNMEVPDADAMSTFGQLNICCDSKIKFIHMHMCKSGSAGAAGVEVYRYRDSSFTLLASLAMFPADGDFATDSVIPADRQLNAGDYLFCQATTGSLFTNGADGMTVDIHFEQ